MELLGQTKFGIRVMTIDDYEKVYSLWMSCKNMGFNNLDDSREGIAKYLKRNPSTCFVAEQGENIVGVILSGHDGRRGFIHHLAVAENCRRQGIATEIGMKQEMRSGRRMGLRRERTWYIETKRWWKWLGLIREFQHPLLADFPPIKGIREGCAAIF